LDPTGPAETPTQVAAAPPAPAPQPAAQLCPSEVPMFTPYDMAPEVRNVEEVRQALVAEYPPLLRDAGVGGTVFLWICVTETGEVANVLVNEEHYSGSMQLDQAALRVGRVFEFAPARFRNQPTAVWVSIPTTFQATQ
jgi:TonB family protein